LNAPGVRPNGGEHDSRQIVDLRCVVIAVMRRVVVAKSSGLGSRVIPLCVAAGVDTYENPCLYQRRSKLSEFAR